MKLHRMFEKQKELQQKLVNDAYVYDMIYIKDMILALQAEIIEVLNETPWKPWKKNQSFNIDNARKEIIDCWHFLINISLALGLDDESVYNMFLDKNKINNKRNENGY